MRNRDKSLEGWSYLICLWDLLELQVFMAPQGTPPRCEGLQWLEMHSFPHCFNVIHKKMQQKLNDTEVQSDTKYQFQNHIWEYVYVFLCIFRS